MAYFVIANIKTDLGISNSNYDTIINRLGADADSEVDEEIKIVVKRLKTSSLPNLPLSTVPTTINEASNSLTKSKFFSRPENKNGELSKMYYDQFRKKIELYVGNLQDENEVYGDIM